MTAPTGNARPERRPPIFGPEPWRDHHSITWSHWDRWACVVAVVDHGGDPAGLEAHLVDQLRSLDGRDATEAKLSHITDLRARLATAGLTARDLAGPDVGADRKLVAKARSKLANRGIEGRAMTPAMRETPRVRLRRRARRGHWPAFPTSPGRFYERFRAAVEVSGHITKGRSFAKTRTLGERLERLDGPRRRLPERLALYRAFHTAGLELADRADDSYGNIGELREKAWRTYLSIDPADAGVDPTVWWQDLCELIVWEPYGLGHDHQTLPYRKLGAVDVETVEAILLSLADEYRAVHLDWEADEALQQVAWMHDTHVVAWYVLDPGEIPAAAVDALEARTAAGEPVLVSAYSVLELVYMREKGKLTGPEFDAIRAVLDDPDGPFVVVPVDDDVAIRAGAVPRSYQHPNGTDEIENADPGDRTIVATALKHTAALVTADRKLRVLGDVLDGLTVIWSGAADEPAGT